MSESIECNEWLDFYKFAEDYGVKVVKINDFVADSNLDGLVGTSHFIVTQLFPIEGEQSE